MALSPDDADKLFAVLETTAVEGQRCPTNLQLGKSLERVPAALKLLVDEGRVLIEDAAHNWRIITILVGEHVGKSTAKAPEGWGVYRRIDAKGDHWLTRENHIPPVRHRRTANAGRLSDIDSWTRRLPDPRRV